MSKEMEFFIFLMEEYAGYKGESAADVLKRWDETGITEKVYSMYEMYHSERLENAFADIDKMMLQQN